MNSRLLLVLVFSILLIPIASFAQTSGDVPIDGTVNGIFTIQNVTVAEKDTYKLITMNVGIKIQNLDSNRVEWFSPDTITLVNENGTSYYRSYDCQGPESFVIDGSNGGMGTFSNCYKVEKDFYSFKIQYQNNALKQSYEIGSIDLNKTTDMPITTFGSGIQNPNMEKLADFFVQLFNMIKNLFRFS